MPMIVLVGVELREKGTRHPLMLVHLKVFAVLWWIGMILDSFARHFECGLVMVEELKMLFGDGFVEMCFLLFNTYRA